MAGESQSALLFCRYRSSSLRQETNDLLQSYAFTPLLLLFEKNPPPVDSNSKEGDLEGNRSTAKSTALLIPCYKSANIIGPTLDAALHIFPPENIFVIANGNSPEPLDNTEEVCRPYGVNHLWCPVGSKIIAQFVGCYAAKEFPHVLLIDDDCALPPNFPVVSDRLKGRVHCIGYTIKSVGPESSRGTLCQQAQDLEYKISGLQRAFAGLLGSATFPHGAISLWKTDFLKQTFHDHPGFSVSEDWFFGDSCRRLGGRIKMCSAVFVETETPSAVFFSSGGSRGGFGEMTIFKQRFMRWNFFFVNGMWYNMKYILCSWNLGFWELGAKLFVFQEVGSTSAKLCHATSNKTLCLLKPGLRNLTIPPRSLRPTHLTRSPAGILRHHVGRHQRLVLSKRRHLQPGTSTPEEGSCLLEMLAPLLHAL